MKLVAITAYYKPAFVYGGPVHSTAALYEGLGKLGVDITVITTNANGREHLDVPLLDPVDVEGIRVIYCPSKPRLGSEFYSPSLVDVAKQYIQHADVVNLQTFWGYATRPLTHYCIDHQIPYFISVRGQLMDYAMRQMHWTKRLKKHVFLHYTGYRYLNHAAALHCTSDVEITHLQAYPINTPRFLVPNSLDVAEFEQLPPRGQLRKRYHIPDDALVMVMIGRIHSVKNPHIAIAALAATQELPTDVHLLMVGPDEHRLFATLQEQAGQAGCADKLHFTGLVQRRELMQVFADSDLLVMPSQTENFGMSAAEAMSAGLPILVSDNVPVGKWAKTASTGATAACDPAAFSEAAVALLSDSARLKEMGNNGRAAAAKFFDHQVVAQDMLRHLEQIVIKANERHD